MDGGVSFSKLPTALAAVTPVELPDGRLASLHEGKLAVSADGGESWSPIGEPLPFSRQGSLLGGNADPSHLALGCGRRVLSDAIQRAGFDYLTQ